MPRPVYIICAESGAEDTLTGLLSHYKVLEKIQETASTQEQIEPGPNVISLQPLRVAAVWMRTEGDAIQQEYEFETAFILPPEGKEIVVQTGKFVFDADKPLYRMLVIGYAPLFRVSGMFRVESRVRKIGEKEWQRQDYPIVVEAVPPPDEKPPE